MMWEGVHCSWHDAVVQSATERARSVWTNPREIYGQKSHDCDPAPGGRMGESPHA